MNVGQTLVRNAELHAAGRIDLDHVHKLPGNGVRGETARNRFQSRSGKNSLEDPAKGAAQSDFDFGHPQQVRRSLAHPLQIHIVDAHHLVAVHVDDLPVDQVLLQVQIVAVVL